jgi:AmpE protein
MSFLSVLLALFIERALPQHRPQRRHGWFDSYCRRLAASPFARQLLSRPWGAVLALLPPLIVIAWLQAFFGELGGLFALVFGTAVLLYSLGPRDLGEEAEAFIEARDEGRDDEASAIAQGLCLSEAPAAEPRRSFAVARAVVVLAAARLIGPIFWFFVFGAVGAAAYRAIHLLAARLAREDCPAAMQRHSETLRQLADWAPARLTAAGYAVAGNFDAVAHAWRSFDYHAAAGGLGEAEQLLAQTGLAALDTFPADADELADDDFAAGGMPVPPVVEDALALVWRNLAIWVVLIAVGSLAAALA